MQKPKKKTSKLSTYRRALIICYRNPFNPVKEFEVNYSIDAMFVRSSMRSTLFTIADSCYSGQGINETTIATARNSIIHFHHKSKSSDEALRTAIVISVNMMNYLNDYYFGKDSRSMAYISSIKECGSFCDNLFNSLTKLHLPFETFSPPDMQPTAINQMIPS